MQGKFQERLAGALQFLKMLLLPADYVEVEVVAIVYVSSVKKKVKGDQIA